MREIEPEMQFDFAVGAWEKTVPGAIIFHAGMGLATAAISLSEDPDRRRQDAARHARNRSGEFALSAKADGPRPLDRSHDPNL